MGPILAPYPYLEIPMTSTFPITLSEAKAECTVCFIAGLVPLILSQPGVGKSAIARDLAQEHNLELIDIRLAQTLPEDLNGFPTKTYDEGAQTEIATFIPFDTFPTESTPLPEGKSGWLIFLDELTAAPKPVQVAAYKLLHEKEVGQRKLHPNVVMMAAGNRAEDNAVTTAMSTATMSRLVPYTVAVSLEEFTTYAFDNKLDPRVIAFVNFDKQAITSFDPKNDVDRQFCCPRTLEHLSRLFINEPDITDIHAPRAAGAIGEHYGSKFIAFAKAASSLPSYADIIANPQRAVLPSEPATQYAVMSMVAANVTMADLNKALDYIGRLSIELQIVFARGVQARFDAPIDPQTPFGRFMQRIYNTATAA